MTISERIFERLRQLSMTQKEFAKKIGKSESEISVWLTGRHNFTLKTLAKVSSVFSADIVAVPEQ